VPGEVKVEKRLDESDPRELTNRDDRMVLVPFRHQTDDGESRDVRVRPVTEKPAETT